MIGTPPAWAAPPTVGALMTDRRGGVSLAPWDSLNLGTAVGDDPAGVAENRARFAAATGARPVWLQQVHGARVVRVGAEDTDRPRHGAGAGIETAARLVADAGIDHAAPHAADAAWTTEPGIACTVQVADCLPVLFATLDGRGVAAAHAGWRGLAAGVLEATLDALCKGTGCAPRDVAAWLGPCIGPQAFEVGADVLAAFGASAHAPDPARFVSRPRADGSPRWLANLPQLARDRLLAAGVERLAGSGACTVEDPSRFFSFRRDGVTGRMVAAVWRIG